MCFRPAGVDLPDPECPECGKKLAVIGGVVMKKCPFCKADLSKYEEEYKAKIAGAMGGGAPGAPAPPGAPGAPKPPGAPGAPKPPGAPGAPKPPGAPGAPKPPGA
ncbi:MAG: hypothetical protein LBC35_06800 [Coriobacteriales bacterium]|jgi:hypothetical protein|nr:hypothetical protein [Coriobacteriales bacterium]